MTRRRFYAPSDSFSPDASITLSAEEARHLRNVLRLQLGEEVFVFDGAGNEYRCTIAEIRKASALLSVREQVAPAATESTINLTLAVSLLKGEKFDLVVQKATELGVTRVLPIITARADAKIRGDADGFRKVSRWQRIALEATKQCGRARLLKIETPVTVAELIDQPEAAGGMRLMFAEHEGGSLSDLLRAADQSPASMTALIGPEGGWTDEEISKARANDWNLVTLGGRILRAETAAIVAATLLQHRCGDLT